MRRRLSDFLLLTVVPLAGSLVMRLLALTLRLEVVDRPVLSPADRGIYAFWHGRMLIMPFVQPEGRFSVMISRHRDGEIIVRTMKWLGIDSSRGSTTRGGASALRDVLRLAKGGYNIAFTPDGPKGPRFAVQSGVVQAAKATGLPIYPVTYSARRRKVFGSWDGFVLPYPFSKAVLVFGQRVEVPREADKDEIEARRAELEGIMRAITERADGYWG